MGRYLYVIPAIVLYTAVLGVLMIVSALIQPFGRTINFLIRLWAKLILVTTGVRVNITGLENIDPKSPCIFMSNHMSHYDVLALAAYVPVAFRAIAKKELFKIPVFGQALSTAGFVSIDRDDRDSAFASIDLAAEKVRSGIPILVFVEGTRSPDGKLGPFKKGGFVLATKAHVPVIPISVSGSYEILPKHTLKMRSGTIRIVVDKPIDTSDYSPENKAKLMDEVRRAIAKNLPAEAVATAAP